MSYDFVAQHAPELAVPPQEGWVTPEPQAGLQNLYGADGMPLNYIQDQGGARQFYAPQGAYAAPQTPPVRARAAPAPAPLGGLRGLTDPNAPTFDIPILSQRPVPPPQPDAPQNILTPPTSQQAPARPPYNGPRARADIPGNPRTMAMGNQVAGLAMDQRAMEMARNPQAANEPPLPQYRGSINPSGTPFGTHPVLDIPPDPRGRSQPNNLPDSLDTLRNPQDYTPNEVLGSVRGTTLLDMLESAQFPVPSFLRNLDPNRAPVEGLRGRGQRGNTVRLDNLNTIIDIEADLRNQPQVQRTGARAPNGFIRPANATEWQGRAPEIEQLLRSRDIRLTQGAAYRTNNARQHGHPEGNSIDIPPGQYEQAIAIIRQDPRFANIPMQPRFIRRGTDFGNGVRATADHYHIDLGPAAER